jgi:tRNA (cytidine/uridine-2'-O-)-methyltransferase
MVGLPTEIIAAEFVSQALNIPMRPGLRSLNLSNSIAIVVFEAWRQHRFQGSG